MAAHETPCSMAVRHDTEIKELRKDVDINRRMLVGNGDRSQSVMYRVDEIYSEVFHRKRDWPLIIASAIAILGVLASIWAN
jgi:hypothetical protein